MATPALRTTWYEEWVDLHCQVIGADASVARMFFLCRSILVDEWRATPAELGECTQRLVSQCRVPKFPNEQTEAVGVELRSLRAERATTRAAFVPADCPACGGSGLAVVPHRRCVWNRRLVFHPDTVRETTDAEGRPMRTGRIATGAVLCDRPGCTAGDRARQHEAEKTGTKDASGKSFVPRATLSRAERFHNCDLVALLREYEREQVAAARKAQGPSPLDPILASILAKITRED